MNARMERQIFLILLLIGTIFLLTSLNDPGAVIEDWDKISRAQNLIVLVMWCVFLLEVLPDWFKKLGSMRLRQILMYACIICVIVIIGLLFPEIQGDSYTEQKLINTIVIIAVVSLFYVCYFLIGKWYDKKHCYSDL